MSQVPPFPDVNLDALVKMLAQCGSNSEISLVLGRCGLRVAPGDLSKSQRLYQVFRESQERYRCANQILDFIQDFLAPARFSRREAAFEAHREELNLVLVFSGLEYGRDGKFRQREAAQTLRQAEQRVRTIQSKFRCRRIHPEVMKYCRTELLEDNYFHAVFEASKGLMQRIRELSGVHLDGAALVDSVFSGDSPILAINSLQTVTEKSEQKGFATLLKGCFGAIRNPLAHGPKILWEGEDDAADYLTLISLMHRKLDNCKSTPKGP